MGYAVMVLMVGAAGFEAAALLPKPGSNPSSADALDHVPVVIDSRLK
jgi:hypothetical protein